MGSTWGVSPQLFNTSSPLILFGIKQWPALDVVQVTLLQDKLMSLELARRLSTFPVSFPHRTGLTMWPLLTWIPTVRLTLRSSPASTCLTQGTSSTTPAGTPAAPATTTRPRPGPD